MMIETPLSIKIIHLKNPQAKALLRFLTCRII